MSSQPFHDLFMVFQRTFSIMTQVVGQDRYLQQIEHLNVGNCPEMPLLLALISRDSWLQNQELVQIQCQKVVK